MIVTRENFESLLDSIEKFHILGLDTETTGLKAYHNDRLFSLILSTPEQAWYFNFQEKPDIPPEAVLPRDYIRLIFDRLDIAIRMWEMHNAKFDMSMLWREGIELCGFIYCTKAMARVEYNDHFKYSLKDCLERLPGATQKSDAVMEYIQKHGLKTKVPVPGKKTEEELLHFDRVPFDIIVPYGLADGMGTSQLGRYQRKRFQELDNEVPKLKAVGRSLDSVMNNEMRLTKTVFEMEKVGVKIDRLYCERAIKYEGDRCEKEEKEFQKITGEKYSASAKLFERVFASERDKWAYTEKGNPSFESDVLHTFSSPAARSVRQIRDAKAKRDFYYGFLHHADRDDVIHPSLVPEGTVHGRFSSNNPNFQNLKADEEEATANEEFIVRRAIIPRPGYVLIMPDYDQMEYKFCLELACKLMGFETDFAKLINQGMDFHQGTVELVDKVAHKKLERKTAKISNFLTLYGGGDAKLASAIGSSTDEARTIRLSIMHAAPEINQFIRTCIRSAEAKGYVINWLGRRSWFPDKRFCYRSPNYIVSGGCADVVKVAMNNIHDYLQKKKSRMIMSVHDELPIEVHESELSFVPKAVNEIMENAYKSAFVPLTAGMEWSAKSLGDKVKGYPV